MGPGAGRYDTPVDRGNLNSTYGLICQRVSAGSDVLDVGCAGGGLAKVLETELGCRVLGVDVDRDAVATAVSLGLEARVLDLTQGPASELLGERTFDVIILADVLEHLVEPAQLLRSVKELLRPQGKLLISFPNVTHLDVALMLAQDDWRYQKAGILDSTHLRFFTLGRFRELAFACGYDVRAVERVILPPLGTEVLDYGRDNALADPALRALTDAVQGGNPNARVYQYVLELSIAPERTADSSSRAEPAPGTGSAQPDPEPPQLDVIVRSMEGRLPLLKDALYSLVAQGYSSVRAIVVLHTSDPSYPLEVQGLLEGIGDLLRAEVVVVPRDGGLRGQPLNSGLELVQGEFLAFCDDDDVLYPTFAERLVGHLVQHPELTLAYGVSQVVQGERTEGGFRALSHPQQYRDPFDRTRLFHENYIPINTYVLRVADLRSAQICFDETMPVYEDWVFLRELAARFEFAHLDQVVSEYRLWGEHSNAVPASQEAIWQETRAAVLRAYGAQPVRVRAEELAALIERSQRELARVAEMEDRLAEAADIRRALLQSRSWKLTRPLRRLLRSTLPEQP